MYIISYLFYFLFMSSLSFAMDIFYFDTELTNCESMRVDQSCQQQGRKNNKRKESPTSVDTLGENFLEEKLDVSSFHQVNEETDASNFYSSIKGIQSLDSKKGRVVKYAALKAKTQKIKSSVEIIEAEDDDILKQEFLRLSISDFDPMDLPTNDSGRECNTVKFFNLG